MQWRHTLFYEFLDRPTRNHKFPYTFETSDESQINTFYWNSYSSYTFTD